MSLLKQFLILLVVVLLFLVVIYVQASHSTVFYSGVLRCFWTSTCEVSKQRSVFYYGLKSESTNTSYNGISTQEPCNVSAFTLQTWKRHRITELQPRIPVDCSKLVVSDKQVKSYVKSRLSNWTSAESEKQWYDRLLASCDSVHQELSEASFYNSKDEINFPIAYIFIVYKNPRQILRLLKAIYRPQNLYCIHPDAKQTKIFIKLFKHISTCLPNIFVASKLEKVYYLHHSLMDAQMNCMRDLLAYEDSKWKYVINLCGRELPLKTNRETVNILKEVNGKTLFQDIRPTPVNGNRWKQRCTWKFIVNNSTGKAVKSKMRIPRPPNDLKIFKSSTFIAATREFVDYLLNDPVSKRIYNYIKDCQMSEEHYFATVFQHGVKIPNSPIHGKVVVSRHKVAQVMWGSMRSSSSCEGGFVHSICIVTSSDLDLVFRYGVSSRGRKQQTFLFFNKYFMEKDHVVMDCMEEHLISQNIHEYKTDCDNPHQN